MSQTIGEIYSEAVREHRRGQLEAAEELYRKVLALKADHAEALQHLGLIAHENGDHAEAVELTRRGIACGANSARAFYNLGVALGGKGDLDEAIAAYERAIAIDANLAAAHNNLGNTLREKGDLPVAIGALQRAAELEPGNAQTLNNLGVALRAAGRNQEAIGIFRRSLALRADSGQTHYNLGSALRQLGDLEGAVDSFLAAATQEPGVAQIQSDLGAALAERGQLRESAAAYGRAAGLRPESAEAQNNWGVSLSQLRRMDEAIWLYRKAIEISPEFAEAHHNLALALLATGQFEEGWREFQWRWKWKDFPSPRRNFPQPAWDGGPLGGRTLLAHAEQGIGDTIQFARYVRILAERGESIVFECAPELVGLLERAMGFGSVRTVGRQGLGDAHLPAFDVHAPLLSLPLLMGLPRPEDAGSGAYLQMDDAIEAGVRLAEPGFKVGIVWAGSPRHRQDRWRSMRAGDLAPLLECDARFYSLQVGDAAKQVGELPGVIDLSAGIGDFLDTARLMSQMDLVISVDTAAAHLAGAMGKPAWVLIPAAGDFRWMLEREDSPWYRSLRLFRQQRLGDWGDVIGRMAEALRVCLPPLGREHREQARRLHGEDVQSPPS